MTMLRRRGIGEEETTPTPSYTIHTVTSAMTKAPTVGSYFQSVNGTSHTKGYFWIRNGASSIPNNHLISHFCTKDGNQGMARWRSGNIASVSIGPSYDVVVNAGDKFLEIDFGYDLDIYVPSNMGVSVTSGVASATCTTKEEFQNILPARPSVVIPKKIGSVLYSAVYGVKGVYSFSMTGTHSASYTTSNPLYINRGDPIWIIKYN